MLLDDLITQLSDSTNDICDVLFRAKVLLSDFDEPTLVEWVNNELNGYAEGASLPKYRVLNASVIGNVACIAYRQSNLSLPVGHLREATRREFQTANVREGLPVVQDMLARLKPTGKMARPIAPELFNLFEKGLAEGFFVDRAWSEVNPAQMKNIAAQVRSRLLDFLLALRTKVGRNVPEERLAEQSRGLDLASAFKGAMFGDNATIVIGSSSHQSVSVVHSENRLELVTAIERAGLPPSEIAELTAAIEHDENNGGKASFDGATGKWYTGLLGKIGKGTVKIGMDVATTVIAKALSQYMGLPP